MGIEITLSLYEFSIVVILLIIFWISIWFRIAKTTISETLQSIKLIDNSNLYHK